MDGVQAKIERATRVTRREMDVLRGIAAGFSSREIADHQFVSRRTIDFHRANLLKKLQARNAVQLLAQARRLGLLPFEPR